MGKPTYSWNDEKDELLRNSRGVSFAEVVDAIESKGIVDEYDHPTRLNQKILVVEISNYLCSVPFVEQRNNRFLKTIFRSRKLTAKYGWNE
jgi:uncharacterized DUF497 family protein